MQQNKAKIEVSGNETIKPPLLYRPDIDGLRGIAVTAVVLCHASLGMPGGFIGVDVFFVISGYLITSIIVRDAGLKRFSFLDFWERRVRRIAPALITMVGLTTIATWVILLPEDLKACGEALIWVTLMAGNVYFWRTTDYFDPAAEEKPFLHTWSLGVEEQFYLCIPVLITLFVRWQLRQRIGICFAALALGSFGLSVYGVAHRPAGTFYLLPTRAWELLAGCLLAVGCWPALEHRKPVREVLACCGLLLILIPCFTYTAATPFPGLAALPSVVGAFLVIGAGARGETIASRLLSHTGLVYIGLISYSLYLWHWPIFSLARYISIGELSVSARVLLVLVSVFIASVSLHLVETPFRQRKLLASRTGINAFAFVAALLCTLTGIAAWRADGLSSRLSDRQRAFQSTATGETKWQRNLDASDVPGNLLRLGVESNEFQVLIWGDSHARAVLPALHSVCLDSGMAAVGAIRSANPPVLGVVGKSHLGGNEEAIPFNKRVMDCLTRRPIKAVFLVAYWDIYLDVPAFDEKLCETIRKLVDVGIKVYVLSDVPRYDFDVPRFLVLYSGLEVPLESLGQGIEEYQLRNRRFSKLIPAITQAGGEVVATESYLPRSVDGGKFLPFAEGHSLYSDSHHLSISGAKCLRPLFEEALRK